MELASLLKVTFELVLLVSQSLTQQALQRDDILLDIVHETPHLMKAKETMAQVWWVVNLAGMVLLQLAVHQGFHGHLHMAALVKWEGLNIKASLSEMEKGGWH